MNHTLTLEAQAIIDEMAQNGITLQELAPIVGLAAEFAAVSGWKTIWAHHIQRAIKVLEVKDETA